MGTLGGTETGRVTTRTPRVTGRQSAVARGTTTRGDVTSAVAETTAEIPVLPPVGSVALGGVAPTRAGWAEATVRERSSGVVLPDGTLWYPGGPKREPAPFVLRFVVWVLFFLLLCGCAGLAVEHVHPDWLSFARNGGSPAVVLPGDNAASASTTAGGGSAPASGHFGLVANSRNGATYATGTNDYTLVLNFTHPVWTVVASPAGSKSFLVEQTLQPNASPKRILVHGSASVQLSAATTSIEVVHANKTIGTVSDPAVGDTYIFRPSAH